MNPASPILWTAAALLVSKWVAQLGLEGLNQQHVRRQANAVPDAFRGSIDEATYARSIAYTLAKSRLHRIELTFDFVVLVLVLASGVLPLAFDSVRERLGASAGSDAMFLWLAGFAFGLASLPFDWHAQFRLEQRFGFNTTTQRTWWLDRLKATLLGAALGYPLLVLVLKCVAWAGPRWWLWAWTLVMVFQLVMIVLAPILILPWFNKFTPLSDGSLRDRLLALGTRTGFAARSIQVMDGSRRSRHSNAFFTGFGRFRKIALFDTLIAQLTEAELEAVLAHEIGHFKRRHIPQRLAVAAAGLLAGFGCIGWLAEQPAFAATFGFHESGAAAATLLLAGLLSGAITFWFAPLSNRWSRRHEYEADAFAARAIGMAQPLTSALRKLSEQNLSNLTPHPLYSGFYYSHPTLLERERALQAAGSSR